MKSVVRFLVGLFMPLILIVCGAALTGLGATYDWEIMIYAGFATIGAGIVWGIFLFLWAGGADF